MSDDEAKPADEGDAVGEGAPPAYFKALCVVISEMAAAAESADEDGLRYTPEAVAAFVRFFATMVQHGVRDLEAFAAHAKRRSIAPEDVLLLCRHSPALHRQLSALHSASEHSKPSSARKSRASATTTSARSQAAETDRPSSGTPKKRKH
ncbi:hypothetical protein DIPPA_07393 [Diplonema papillatum]|nr:hypothetical protein DIPPA_07393 [Diplonema papillatum]